VISRRFSAQADSARDALAVEEDAALEESLLTLRKDTLMRIVHLRVCRIVVNAILKIVPHSVETHRRPDLQVANSSGR
jgi:hypothetical protein